MLTLTNLKSLRVLHDVPRPLLASLTSIPPERLKQLDLRQVEPWLSEAAAIARVLGTSGILPLIGSDDLTTLRPDPPLPVGAALTVWRSGNALPLSAAIELALAFGLDDPAELVTPTPRIAQLWAILGSGERTDGVCPWCAAEIAVGEHHLPTCLPTNLWGRAIRAEALPWGHVLRPADKPGQNRGGRGVIAHGLKYLRVTRRLRQSDVAALLGIDTNYYARLEREDMPLRKQYADRLAIYYNVPVETIYTRPVEQLPEGSGRITAPQVDLAALAAIPGMMAS